VDARQTDGGEHIVDEAVILKEGHPCVGAQQEVHPHGQHDEQNEEALAVRRRFGDGIRERVAEQKRNKRCECAEPDGTQEDVGILADARDVI